ncbi:MAG TPA: hypothetical protein QGG47_12645, partial [Acidobacteriota bacterium]|nr:hypothetical protein [Acidobacteriota bacterium]
MRDRKTAPVAAEAALVNPTETGNGSGPVMMFGSLDAVAGLLAERIQRAGFEAVGVGLEEPPGWPGEA